MCHLYYYIYLTLNTSKVFQTNFVYFQNFNINAAQNQALFSVLLTIKAICFFSDCVLQSPFQEQRICIVYKLDKDVLLLLINDGF